MRKTSPSRQTRTNISTVALDKTASTREEICYQRAENLYYYGAKSVLELCCGPSLKSLEAAYKAHDIKDVWGNDIDIRWKLFYPQGRWLIGDAVSIEWPADTIVFAPPLSIGCTGNRDDSLKIKDIIPKYTAFLDRFIKEDRRLGVLVLPARSLATSEDKSQLFELIGRIRDKSYGVEMVEMKTKKRDIRKYVDLYMYKQ